MLNIVRSRLALGVVTESVDPGTVLPDEGAELRKIIFRQFGRSLFIREVDTGSCGACESEICACNNPLYDLQRFGVQFVASPRHADCLLVTGPLSKNMVAALRSTWEAMPEPKFAVSVGECAIDGGPFKGAYYVEDGVSSILPVAAHIPGCPPEPRVIIRSLIALIRTTGNGTAVRKIRHDTHIRRKHGIE